MKLSRTGDVNTNAEHLKLVPLAEDIVFIAETIGQLQTLLQILLTGLVTQSSVIDLKMDHIKTKYMQLEEVAQSRIEVGSN